MRGVSDVASFVALASQSYPTPMNKVRRTIQGIFGGMRQRALSSLQRREYLLPDTGPIVSFTFDDFPRSALDNGGEILKSYGGCGTYYAAVGLMGRINELGELFDKDDIERLLARGHELGSHTFSHMSCRANSLEGFEADTRKGRDAIIKLGGRPELHNFAYPFGHMTVSSKRRIGPQMASSRSVFMGINTSPVDLHMLRAVFLYNGTTDFESMDHLFRLNDRKRGWLIFYTHDVSEKPSQFGCKPKQFERVVRSAIHAGARIVTVGGVLDRSPLILSADSSENHVPSCKARQ